MPEQMGCCDDQAIRLGVGRSESDERSNIFCSEADASPVSFPFAIPDLFFVIKNNVICNFGVFLATVCDEQTMFFTTSGFVNRIVTRILEGGDELLEPIDFLCVSLDESSVWISFFYLKADDIGVR